MIIMYNNVCPPLPAGSNHLKGSTDTNKPCRPSHGGCVPHVKGCCNQLVGTVSSALTTSRDCELRFPKSNFVDVQQSDAEMPRQITQNIPNYWLREDALKGCLGRFFPNQVIIVEPGEESYNITIPRELAQNELDIINSLRVDPNKKKKKKKKDGTQ
ncbi:hypothetical protein F5B22DRAFT_185371 [Xylaria bambusicola]|uniref:uncharacterized protein n=1 Tax=Xylaria bambusicola TaxID=326684 RepID=UPI00200861D5|nr:uncharacterized protein F5B22DRAFT_185371 [Xylaria bambusicola]KAI0515369.1 hypothetical protein F5B22DRAFT_185371 [Xylaria bambusicola]